MPISTFCPPLSKHCLFVQGDMEVKVLIVTDKNKQYHKPLNPLNGVYCPTVPQTVCLLDKRCTFMLCKINTGPQCKCSCMYKHLLSPHQLIRYKHLLSPHQQIRYKHLLSPHQQIRYKHLLSPHQQIRYNIRIRVRSKMHDRPVTFHFL